MASVVILVYAFAAKGRRRYVRQTPPHLRQPVERSAEFLHADGWFHQYTREIFDHVLYKRIKGDALRRRLNL